MADNPNGTYKSNCNLPGSKASDDVQKRAIGCCEAWVVKGACNGMSISRIPINALTCLRLSFVYIAPALRVASK